MNNINGNVGNGIVIRSDGEKLIIENERSRNSPQGSDNIVSGTGQGHPSST